MQRSATTPKQSMSMRAWKRAAVVAMGMSFAACSEWGLGGLVDGAFPPLADAGADGDADATVAAEKDGGDRLDGTAIDDARQAADAGLDAREDRLVEDG